MNFKHPKTLQEMKYSIKYEKYTRPKRNHKNLPNSWDDVIYKTPKCWKNQYKVKKSYLIHKGK